MAENNKVNTKFLWETCRTMIKIINDATKIENGDKKDPSAVYDEIVHRLEETKPVQDKLVDVFSEVLARIRSHMVIGRDQFFGLELLQMELKPDLTLYPKHGEAPITTLLNKRPMQIRVNPLFLERYTAAHIESMIVSELLGLSFSYPVKFSKINTSHSEFIHKAMNRAASAATTEMVKNYVTIDRLANKPGMKLADQAYTVEDLRFDAKLNAQENQTFEYYYSIYNQNIDESTPDTIDQEMSEDVFVSSNGDNNLPSTPNFHNGKNSVHNWEEQYSPEETESNIKNMLKNAMDAYRSSSNRGTLPEALKCEIDIMLAKPKIDWKKTVANLTGILAEPFRRTPARLNKKYPERTDMSGKLPKHKIRIVCILDVSGSMDNRDYEYCINEVLGASKANETEVTVIECDTDVSAVYKLDSKKFNKKITRSASGGTCFTPAIEYVNSHNYSDVLCIYFTDGYGEREIPKPKVQKMMWVVLESSDNLSVKNPYGIVRVLKDDDKYCAMKGI